MNNNLIFNQKIEDESIKIFHKFLECVKNKNDVIKFIDYVNTIVNDKNNFSEIERYQIIQSVLSKIFIAYSSKISNGVE